MSQKLNCWPGCNAIIVRSMMGNEGKVVHCERIARLDERIESECGESVMMITHLGEHTTWLVDRPVLWSDGHEYRAVKDVVLRPLRDEDGQDEMLRIVGMPNKETTPSAH